ncbi:MAG: hypothetical protein QMD46_05880 [Methanomicrobiales archaeon]|nr:hypothetical protein [Methanomicrobiales archaeon]MDI6876204.1 hypothetical protein [Methanomicrobiales archaeon]
MKDRWLIILVAVVVVVVLIRPFLLPDKPAVDYHDREIYLPSEPYNPRLVQLWDTLLEELQFDNASAIFRSLTVDISSNGTVQSLTLDFYANNESDWRIHRAYVDEASRIYLTSQSIELIKTGDHPLALLSNIDQLPLYNIPLGERGITINVLYHTLGKKFTATHENIYALNKGMLEPLKEVTFPSGGYWYEIKIISKSDPIEVATGSDASVMIDPNTTTSCEENPQCTLLFTEQDLEKAESVLRV